MIKETAWFVQSTASSATILDKQRSRCLCGEGLDNTMLARELLIVAWTPQSRCLVLENMEPESFPRSLTAQMMRAQIAMMIAQAGGLSICAR